MLLSGTFRYPVNVAPTATVTSPLNVDTPLTFKFVLPTDRTVDFSVSAAEGEGGVTLLGFSFTGAEIAEGDGPIVEVVYDIGMVEFDSDVEVGLSGSILSDPNGNGIEHDLYNGTFMVYAGDLMVPATPENVIAEGGQNNISLCLLYTSPSPRD